MSKPRRESTLKRWGVTGIPSTIPRAPFPVERAISSRLGGRPILWPVPLRHTGNAVVDRQLAWHLKALELFPAHPDTAFETIWRSLEQTSKLLLKRSGRSSPNATDALDSLLPAVCETRPRLTGEALQLVSLSFCQYVWNRLYIKGATDDSPLDHGAMKRLGTGELAQTFRSLRALHSGDGRDPRASRDAALAVQAYVRGLAVKGVDAPLQAGGLEDRLRFVLFVGLYALRNEMIHAEGFPQLFSSEATLTTYASLVTNFAFTYFVATTALGLCEPDAFDSDEFEVSSQRTFDRVQEVFGSHIRR